MVKVPGGDVDLQCGGHPMAVLGGDVTPGAEVKAGFDEGTQVGKRYVEEDAGVEVLCTKAGSGSLSVGDVALTLKGAKPLPSSD